MNEFRIIAANILQGFVFAGKSPEDQIFSRFSPQEYIEYFKVLRPDILAIAELLFDDDKGTSKMGEQIASGLSLPYWKTFSPEKSWMYKGKYYGQGLFTKYPLKKYKTCMLPNPKLEVDKPDGQHWILHDRGFQSVIVEINNQKVAINNIHGFPFHHFKRRLNEPEFTNIRQIMVREFTQTKNIPTIIAGDFNTKDITLEKAFPEIFKNKLFETAMKTGTTIVFGSDQLDHILFTPQYLTCRKAFAERFLSDHYALIADFALTK